VRLASAGLGYEVAQFAKKPSSSFLTPFILLVNNDDDEENNDKGNQLFNHAEGAGYTGAAKHAPISGDPAGAKASQYLWDPARTPPSSFYRRGNKRLQSPAASNLAAHSVTTFCYPSRAKSNLAAHSVTTFCYPSCAKSNLAALLGGAPRNYFLLSLSRKKATLRRC